MCPATLSDRFDSPGSVPRSRVDQSRRFVAQPAAPPRQQQQPESGRGDPVNGSRARIS